MKTKVDYSLFTPAEIEFVKSDMGGIVKKDNPHYSRITLYYYNIEEGRDETVIIECSQTFMAYNLKVAVKQMKQKGYTLPYRTEWQRIIDPEQISTIQMRESLVEL